MSNDEWRTPDPLFRQLDELYGPFNIDAAATAENSKCDTFIGTGYSPLRRSIAQDALGLASWMDLENPGKDRIWLNPPYSRGKLAQFLARAADEAKRPKIKLVCCLIPAATDTAYWHDIVMKRALEVVLLRGRVKFIGADAGAKFPSAAVIFDGLDGKPEFRSLERRR